MYRGLRRVASKRRSFDQFRPLSVASGAMRESAYFLAAVCGDPMQFGDRRLVAQQRDELDAKVLLVHRSACVELRSDRLQVVFQPTDEGRNLAGRNLGLLRAKSFQCGGGFR
jgi:hypothetical protein